MIPNVSSSINWLKKNSNTVNNIYRGIERETLRVNLDGSICITEHPKIFGAPLTHKLITTDFSESLLEFITPKTKNVDTVLSLLRDIHRYVSKNLKSELMWPLSMPCFIKNNEHIKLAKYGDSNIGRMKTLYRQGLKMRYGEQMQIISGIHYNFSLPMDFWKQWSGIQDIEHDKKKISNGYLCLMRNYQRFGWIIPYLFGASPALCSSFIKDINYNLPLLQGNKKTLYMPYATSLRLSDVGYTNKLTRNFKINFNNLSTYIKILKTACTTPSEKYKKIGMKNKFGDYLQLNMNILQLENELYTHIRPKRTIHENELTSDALNRDGIEYIEIRSLDINPFSPIGINEKQIRFLDLFLIWCIIVDAPNIDKKELFYINKNWDRIILEGRKPGQIVQMCSGEKIPIHQIGTELFNDLVRIAKILDEKNSKKYYEIACNEFFQMIENPELTYSGKILKKIIKFGLNDIGLMLAKKYFYQLNQEPLDLLTHDKFILEYEKSLFHEKEIKTQDKINFETFIKKYTE